MIDDSDERRDAIDAFLRAQRPTDIDRPAVLTGWVLVMEWMADDGECWLTRGHAASLTSWHADGLHHEALYGDWPDDDDEADRG